MRRAKTRAWAVGVLLASLGAVIGAARWFGALSTVASPSSPSTPPVAPRTPEARAHRLPWGDNGRRLSTGDLCQGHLVVASSRIKADLDQLNAIENETTYATLVVTLSAKVPSPQPTKVPSGFERAWRAALSPGLWLAGKRWLGRGGWEEVLSVTGPLAFATLLVVGLVRRPLCLEAHPPSSGRRVGGAEASKTWRVFCNLARLEAISSHKPRRVPPNAPGFPRRA
jgi:hypothetical protein